MRACLARLAALSLALAFHPARAEDGRPAEPNSYRMQDFRVPTPATLSGAQVLTSGEAEEHWRKGKAVFIDVLPQAQRPANLPEGTLWRDKPRLGIPGSLWLPDTGYGALNPQWKTIFAPILSVSLARIGIKCWFSIVLRIAGCRGTPRSAL